MEDFSSFEFCKIIRIYRSSHQRCSIKKVFLKISQNSQENTWARACFLIKLQAWGKDSGLRQWHLWTTAFLFSFFYIQIKLVCREPIVDELQLGSCGFERSFLPSNENKRDNYHLQTWSIPHVKLLGGEKIRSSNRPTI